MSSFGCSKKLIDSEFKLADCIVVIFFSVCITTFVVLADWPNFDSSDGISLRGIGYAIQFVHD